MSDKKRALEGSGEASVAKKLKSDVSTYFLLLRTLPTAQRHHQCPQQISSRRSAPKAPQPTKPAVPIPVVAGTPSPTISSGPTPATESPAPGAVGISDDIARRVSEAKRRVAEAQSKLAVKDNPYMSMPQTKKKGGPVEQTQQGAGLKMAAHPLLLDTTPSLPQSKKDRYKPMQPKFASIKANVRNAPTPPPAPPPVPTPESLNPYAAASVKDTGFEGAPRERAGRTFKFNPKGKYVALANQARQESQLEALKQRIAESARKAGLDGEMGVEKTIKRAPPPTAEWWDAALLPNKNYDDLALGMEKLNIHTPDSPITIYIQHPIPIPAPGDKNKVELKPLMLTKKEQKKMRKLRRAQELQDKRDRIRMGLLPPDPPKVGLKNLMKVLTSDAIQDPTRVEARVRREVAQRKHTHEKMNAERKLTDEQRREKKEMKKAEQEKKGIYGACFKIKILSDPAHQFKVRKNAEQLGLTGVTIFNPQFSMVYVEGSNKGIKHYKRLMLHRIAWTEAARPRGAEDVELEEPEEETDAVAAPVPAPALAPEDAEVRPSLEDNRCYLIWEGQLRDRAFSAFKGKSAPTDRDAKEVLGEKLKGYWDQAKNWRPEEEELF
ncbi:putative PRP3-domain-containing protein [Lyophyllum shimeji]|uniref:PRP3-domain-containing protein n=1 Tax=Lyophyllum shimeji TaxID=47721 RepID=A0A9P3PPI3_LYOSH|nr:putative PRP3-domain-containing protein [Lyophyllum shimeji]